MSKNWCRINSHGFKLGNFRSIRHRQEVDYHCGGDEWNSLGSHMVSADTIGTVKKRLHRVLDGEGWLCCVELDVQNVPCVNHLASWRPLMFLCCYLKGN